MNGPDTGAVSLEVSDFVDGYLAEDDVLLAARQRAARFGTTPIGAAGGAALCFLAATIGARSVVEIGTGTGVSGLWLLRGMAPDGVLTSIDVDPESQRAARSAFLAAGYGPSRLRLINGMGLEVLPRLTDAAYDLVFVDAQPVEYPRHLDEAVRLLRPGGLVVLDDVLPAGRGGTAPPAGRGGTAPRGGRAADADTTDPATTAVREVARQARDDERLVPVLLPVGGGLLCALRR